MKVKYVKNLDLLINKIYEFNSFYFNEVQFRERKNYSPIIVFTDVNVETSIIEHYKNWVGVNKCDSHLKVYLLPDQCAQWLSINL